MSAVRKEPIDWRRLRERVEATTRSIERTWTPDVEQMRRILRQRAIELAVTEEVKHEGPSITVLELLLANERYCIESSFVREVRPLTDLVPLPGTPPFVLGIVTMRGEIVSVIDIGRFFDLPERGLSDRNKVVVLRSGEMVFGIAADAVAGMRRLDLSQMQSLPPTFTGVREKYLRGITHDGLVVLDGARLIHDDAVVVRQDLQEGPPR